MHRIAFLIMSVIICFGDDKTKLILFASKQTANSVPKLNIWYKGKQ